MGPAYSLTLPPSLTSSLLHPSFNLSILPEEALLLKSIQIVFPPAFIAFLISPSPHDKSPERLKTHSVLPPKFGLGEVSNFKQLMCGTLYFCPSYQTDNVRAALPSPSPSLSVATLKSKRDKVPTASHLIEPNTFSTHTHTCTRPQDALLLIKLAMRMSERIISLSQHMTAAVAALLLFQQPGCRVTRNVAAPLPTLLSSSLAPLDIFLMFLNIFILM